MFRMDVCNPFPLKVMNQTWQISILFQLLLFFCVWKHLFHIFSRQTHLLLAFFVHSSIRVATVHSVRRREPLCPQSPALQSWATRGDKKHKNFRMLISIWHHLEKMKSHVCSLISYLKFQINKNGYSLRNEAVSFQAILTWIFPCGF